MADKRNVTVWVAAPVDEVSRTETVLYSISPIFYELLFHAKMLYVIFCTYDLCLYLFGENAASKTVVKWTPCLNGVTGFEGQQAKDGSVSKGFCDWSSKISTIDGNNCT